MRNRVTWITLLAMLGGCQYKGPTIWVDDKTGCEYLIRGEAITPRLDPQGQPICRKVRRP